MRKICPLRQQMRQAQSSFELVQFRGSWSARFQPSRPKALSVYSYKQGTWAGHHSTLEEDNRAGRPCGWGLPQRLPQQGRPGQMGAGKEMVSRGQVPGRDPAHLSPGERVPGIVHDTVEVIGLPQGLHLLNFHLQEVILLPWEDQEKGVWGKK